MRRSDEKREGKKSQGEERREYVMKRKNYAREEEK